MMDSIYEVDREYYKAFLKTLIPEKIRMDIVHEDERYDSHNIYSLTTEKLLCGRAMDWKKELPERYFIYNMPEANECREEIPTLQIQLDTPQEVQAFFDLLRRIKDS